MFVEEERSGSLTAAVMTGGMADGVGGDGNSTMTAGGSTSRGKLC
jgi:hypothetical protein